MYPLLLAALLLQIEPQHEPDPAPPPPAPVLTKAPELLEDSQPTYPEAAQAEEVEGQVVLQITIDAEGAVSEVLVAEGLHPLLDAAAVEAAQGLRFSPAEVDHAPAPVQILFSYTFTLAPPPPPEAPPPPPITLRGRVWVRGERLPLDSAVLKIGAQGVGVDAEGAFEVALPPGNHAVEVKAPGFFSFETTEQVVEGQVTEVNYYLLRRGNTPYETVVRADRARKEVSQVRLQRAELQKIPGTFGDPLRVLENLPGMARAPFLGGQLLVRGANPSDSGVYFDGVELPLLYHFGGLTSVVNAEFLEEINFLPGGFGSEYGRAIGGVVDVRSRRQVGRDTRGTVKIDLMDTGVFVRAPISDTLSVVAAGRRSYIDVLLPPVLAALTPPGQASISLAPVYSDYQLAVEWAPSREHTLSLMFFGSDDTFKVITAGAADDESFQFTLQSGFHRALLTHRWRPSATLESNTRLYGGITTQGLGGGDAAGELSLAFNFDRYEWGLRHDTRLSPLPELDLRAGLDLQGLHAWVNVDLPVDTNLGAFPSPSQGDPDNQQLSLDAGGEGLGLWAEARWRPIEGLEVAPGLRGELYRFDQVYHPVAEPRLSARYGDEGLGTFKAAWGLYHQAPGFTEVNEATGNTQLRPEAARHWVLGYERALSELIDLDVSLFYNERFDLVVSSGETVVVDGEAVDERFNNDGLGRAYGAELLLRHKLSERFFGWIAYTLMRAEERSHPGDPFIATDFDQTHILTLVGSYRLGWGVELGARWRLVSGNPYTPVIASTHDLDSDGWLRVRGETHSARLPTFHQLDLRLEKTWVQETWKLGLFLDLLNSYNQTNVENFQYDYRARTQVPFPGLPIFPVLGLKGVF